MCACPYYLKPNQKSLYNFFKFIAKNTKLPIMLYDIPSRTGAKLENQTIIKLSQINNIISIKDASDNINRPIELKKELPQNFTLLSGDDSSAINYIKNGGDGVVSVASNIIPYQLNQLINQVLNDDSSLLKNNGGSFLDIYKLLFIEPNPAPIKYALSLMKLCNQNIREPLCTLSNKNKNLIKNEMIRLKII